MKYDEDMLRQINDHVNIVDYAKQQFELEQRGDDYYTNCPLHTDETPSLSFSADKNFFYCFSCGRKGQIIRFLMDYEGLKFDQAVEKAASLANIDLNHMCRSDTMAFLRRYKEYNRSRREKKNYRHEILPSSTMEKYRKEEVKEWLEEGISQEAMDLFGVRVDSFANRIVYPVCDLNGNLINVKGRTRYPNYKALKLSKYINYRKVGVMDYFQGLHVTLPYVKQQKEIIVFESVKSVMKAYGWGYKNCASAEKHTLTSEQIELLIKLRSDVVLAYDADVSYSDPDVKSNIEKLRRFTNVYLIEDTDHLLGGKESKNAPVDCGLDLWRQLYNNKRKVV